jgi:hypothetical protein
MRGFYAEPQAACAPAARARRAARSRPAGARRSRQDRGLRRRRRAIDLGRVEAGLAVCAEQRDRARALDADTERIVAAARATVARPGLPAGAIDALYFTGGSTGLRLLTDPPGGSVPGRRRWCVATAFASVATGARTACAASPRSAGAKRLSAAGRGRRARGGSLYYSTIGHRKRGRFDVVRVEARNAEPPERIT